MRLSTEPTPPAWIVVTLSVCAIVQIVLLLCHP